MRQQQTDLTTGGLFKLYKQTDQDFLQNRMPLIGSKVRFDDGREFRFASSEADIDHGRVCAIQPAEASFAMIDNAMAVASADATEVTVDLTGLTLFGTAISTTHPAEDRFAGGYLTIADGPGQGYTYRIKKSTVPAATTEIMTLELYDPLVQAIGTATDCYLTGPKYGSVVEATASNGLAVGIPLVNVTAATDGSEQYFWIQTKGPGTVIASATPGTITPGDAVVVGTTAGGVKLLAAAATEQIIGYAINVEATVVATESFLVELTM
jgi:hypothetical protein